MPARSETKLGALEDAQAILKQIATSPLQRTVAVRSLRAVANFIERADEQALERAAAAPSDCSVLAEELNSPEFLEIIERDDPLAGARIRGQQMMEKLLGREGGVWNVEKVAKRLHMSRQGVDKRRKIGKLLAIELGRRGFLYPAWQFTQGGVLPGLDLVLAQLEEKMISSWDAMVFFLNGSLYLNGSSPLEALRKGNMEGVLRAASTYGEQGAP